VPPAGCRCSPTTSPPCRRRGYRCRSRGLPVQGCKDSSGDADRLLETVDVWGGPLYIGSSSLLSLAGPLGCAGAILALANAEPEGCIAAFAGDVSAQRALAPATGSRWRGSRRDQGTDRCPIRDTNPHRLG